MTAPIEPTIDDLAAAYSSADTGQAENGPTGRQSASAVVVGAAGITVLVTGNSPAPGVGSSVLRLTQDGEVEWQRSLPRIEGRALAEWPGTGWVVAGETRYDTLAYQAAIAVLDASGEPTQMRSIGEPGITAFFSVLVRADGTIVAAGMESGQGHVVCLDRSLRTVWTHPFPGSEQARSLAVSGGSDLIVAACQTSTSGLGTCQLVTLDQQGAERWRLDLPLHGHGEIRTVLAVDDGLIAAGDINTGTSDRVRLSVLKIGLDRATQWEQQEDYPVSGQRSRGATALPAGSFAVITDAASDGGRDLLLLRFTSDGKVTAHQRFTTGNYDIARDVAALDHGDVAVVGSTSSPDDGSMRALIVRINADGYVPWWRTFPHL